MLIKLCTFFALLMPGYQFLFCLVNFCVWKFWKSWVLETAGRVTVKPTCFALPTDLIKRCVNFVSPHIYCYFRLLVYIVTTATITVTTGKSRSSRSSSTVWLSAEVNHFSSKPWPLSSFVAHKAYEPPHDKTNKMICAQRRLRLSLASAQSDRVFAVRMKKVLVLGYPLKASEDSDQTEQMPRLIWVFAWRTVILLVLSWGGSYNSANKSYIVICWIM